MEKRRNWFLRVFDIKLIVLDLWKITGLLFFYLWFRTKRIFLNKKEKGWSKGSYIIATNHVAWEDHFVIMTALPFRRICHVAADNLFKGKWGWFFKLVGTIPIDKENGSYSAVKKVKKTLYNGHVVCMYPEGVLDEEGLKDFKGGVALMAAFAKVDILPIYIGKRKKRFQRKVVIIGERIKYQDLFKSHIPTREEISDANAVLIEKEKELENKYKELYETR